MTVQLNLDGLVGPTHNYAGLSYGNIASDTNKGLRSNPRAAALQGLGKMRTLLSLGLPQGLMPPHERPFLPFLRTLGFSGSDAAILDQAYRTSPTLISIATSASAMWAANAATVSPAPDTDDGRTHFSPANLSTMAHRSLEAGATTGILRKIFADEARFKVHDALPAHNYYSDEGAANHNRMAAEHGAEGLELFVYGRQASGSHTEFPARQTLEACEAIARRHLLKEANTLHILQSAEAIDAGAFHNDVVAVTNQSVLLFHEQAFADTQALKDAATQRANALGFEPVFVMAPKDQMSLADAVKSYFFNSQLETLPSGGMALILPTDAEENENARQFAQSCVDGDSPIEACHYLDVRESMRNGGGPACLRLRVQLSEADLSAMHQPVLMTDAKIDRLEQWVTQHYRDRLEPEDLADANLLDESRKALDELTQILELGALYPFQKTPGNSGA